MRKRRVCICTVQVPFVRGGAELLVESLARELSARGLEVDLIRMPLVSYPKRDVLQSALLWRVLDLNNPILPEIDLCIPTKFPSYAVRHEKKVPWLLHQFRDVYDIFGSDYHHFTNSSEDVQTREAVVEIDNLMLRESERIYTISQTVSRRLTRYNGIASEPLYPPPDSLGELRFGPYGDTILSVGRLEKIKRVELLIRAMKLAPAGLRCLIVGEGSQTDTLGRLIEDLELEDRIHLLGAIGKSDLCRLYSECRAVYYAPYDEDYGYVTVEAFLSGKPVITCVDSGGPLEFVRDRENGWICEPHPQSIADALAATGRPETILGEMGRSGMDQVKDITWDRVYDCFAQFL